MSLGGRQPAGWSCPGPGRKVRTPGRLEIPNANALPTGGSSDHRRSRPGVPRDAHPRLGLEQQELPHVDAHQRRPLEQGQIGAKRRNRPPAKPTTRWRPRQPRERNAGSNSGPQTGSNTISGPCRRRHPDALAKALGRRIDGQVRPSRSANARLAAVEATAITLAPRALPTCNAAEPTPPAAPVTSRVSPRTRRARSRSPCSAVM